MLLHLLQQLGPMSLEEVEVWWVVTLRCWCHSQRSGFRMRPPHRLRKAEREGEINASTPTVFTVRTRRVLQII
jgi:hypothetical protein